MKRSTWIGAVSIWIGTYLMACDATVPDVEMISGAVVGGTATHGPSLTPTGAVGLLRSPSGSSCTGTLAMRADRVLTAAHCVCAGGNDWTFFLANQANVPANEIGLPPNCFAPVPPGAPLDPMNPTNREVSAACFTGTAVKNPQFDCDNMGESIGSDMAVITLKAGVGATTTASVPATLATPQPVYLGHNGIQFMGPVGSGSFAGFGAFTQQGDKCDHTPPLQAEFTRRTMSSIVIGYEDDPCGGLIEGLCHHRPIYLSYPPELPYLGKGDSGGALFAPFNGVPTIVGTLYGWQCPFADTDIEVFAMTADPNTNWRQSMMGENRVWLARELGIPSDINFPQALTEAALYATRRLKINDRATVVPDDYSIAPAKVVATTNPAGAGDSVIEIRNDVQTMDVVAGNIVQLFDRVTVVGDLSASLIQVVQGTQTVTGKTKTDTVVLVDNLLEKLALTFPVGTTPISLEPGATATPTPGDHGDVNLKRGSTLFLSAGEFNFRSLTTEPGSTIAFITPDAPTRISVNRQMFWRGSAAGVSAAKANIFWALREGAVLEAPFSGTIVSPNGSVVVDTATTYPAVVGAILARDIEVHQGRQIRHRPFNRALP